MVTRPDELSACARGTKRGFHPPVCPVASLEFSSWARPSAALSRMVGTKGVLPYSHWVMQAAISHCLPCPALPCAASAGRENSRRIFGSKKRREGVEADQRSLTELVKMGSRRPTLGRGWYSPESALAAPAPFATESLCCTRGCALPAVHQARCGRSTTLAPKAFARAIMPSRSMWSLMRCVSGYRY